MKGKEGASDDREGEESGEGEEQSGSELEGEDESDAELDEGISGSDLDDLIQDDEFEGVSGSGESDGDDAGEGLDDPEGDGEETGKQAKVQGESAGVGTAFARAFASIIKKKVSKSELSESLGPVLAERKQLLVKKLEEEENDKQKKSDRKKRKREERERGHTLPQTYTDAREKALIKLATSGVVRLFNAVSKAQKVQADADISSSRAARETWKQSKKAFMSEIRSAPKVDRRPIGGPEKSEQDEEAGWAALRDDFMLGSSKMKDWDKNLAT